MRAEACSGIQLKRRLRSVAARGCCRVAAVAFAANGSSASALARPPNIHGNGDLIPIGVQPWGEYSTVRLPPERRWYLTNTFSL